MKFPSFREFRLAFGAFSLLAVLVGTPAAFAEKTHEHEYYEYRGRLPELTDVARTPLWQRIPQNTDSAFEFLSQEIRLQVYPGILRGVRGTLISSAGNSADQALLLAYVLKQRGEEVRIASALLSAAETDGLWKRFTQHEKARMAELLENNQKIERLAAEATDPAERENLEEILRARGRILQRLDQTLNWMLQHTAELTGPTGSASGSEGSAPATDAASEAKLRQELRQHFWVQHRRAGSPADGGSPHWVDLDSAAGLPAGVSLKAAERTYAVDQLPSELFHAIEFDVEVTFQDIDEQRSESHLRLKTDSASMTGVPLFLMHPAEGDSFYSAGGFAARLGEVFGKNDGGVSHIPIFRLGGTTLEGKILKMQGWKPADLFAGRPFGSKPNIVSEILKIRLTSPTGPDSPVRELEIERPIFDLAGKHQRSQPGTWKLRELKKQGDLPLALQRAFAYHVSTGSVSEEWVEAAYTPTADDSEILQKQYRVTGYFEIFDEGLRALRAAGNDATDYIAEPNLTGMIVASSRGEPLPTDDEQMAPETSTSFGLDLTWRRLRDAAAGSSGAPAASSDARARGYLTFLSEQVFMEFLTSTDPSSAEASAEPLFSVHPFFAKAAEEGVPLRLLQEPSQLDALDLTDDLKAHLREILAHSDILIPERRIEFHGQPRLAWLQRDRAIGEVRDGTDLFLNMAMTERAELERSSISQIQTLCHFKQCLEAAMAVAKGIVNVVRGRVSSVVDNVKEVIANASNCKGLTLKVKLYKDWKNRADVKEKLGALQSGARSGGLKTPQNGAYQGARAKDPAQFSGGRSAGPNMNWDHKVELACGGRHSSDNIWALDASVNKSIGAVLGRACRKLCEGTKITGFVWDFVL